MRAEARETEEALKKARREQAKAARNTQKQLETGSKTSQKKPRGRPPKQKKPQELSATAIELNGIWFDRYTDCWGGVVYSYGGVPDGGMCPRRESF
jgi:hypothetical protein